MSTVIFEYRNGKEEQRKTEREQHLLSQAYPPVGSRLPICDEQLYTRIKDNRWRCYFYLAHGCMAKVTVNNDLCVFRGEHIHPASVAKEKNRTNEREWKQE